MYDVLIAIDTDEERGAAQGEAVANLPHSTEEVRAYLMHVFGDNPEGGSVHQVAAVKRAVERLEQAGVEYEYRESSGDPATTILDEAEALDVDAICLSGRKQTPTGKVIFGSVTQSVILEATRPVICVPTE